MRTLIPPRKPCEMCQGTGRTTYSGFFIDRCWCCSGRGKTRDWHGAQLAVLHGASLLAAAAAGGTFVAWRNGDLDHLAQTMATFLAVTP
ncbi:hypothetical protein [Planomonospora sp. ID82291]|uniref:hypothetical protein n=1 Tax=Planomonospora sp. ID82291 TaxID=2738136 RepID=UPI0018C3A854|nr:hypothetical protein [Planomonospora sp. ID82291]MBG0818999.1 hypothetical protein [Planomonospora sp. ID82291]